MWLDAQDWEPSIVIVSGKIVVSSPTRFTYTLQGMPEDVGLTLRSLNRQRDSPYDGLKRFRLRAVDDRGNALSLGRTIPNVNTEGGEPWIFTGDTESIWADDPPADYVGTENLYLLSRNHLARHFLGIFVSNGKTGAERQPEYRLPILGTELIFKLDDRADTLTIAASESDELPQTLTENWLGEPLRILFGQLIFPRMVARANPTGAMISVRPSPTWHKASNWVALWGGADASADKDRFWRTYAQLLTFIAQARDKSGQTNYEANKLTRLYEEVIQASRGSRWVWALTIASSVEGVIRLIVPRGTQRSEANLSGIADLARHIDAWSGSDGHLRQVAKNAISRTAEISPIRALRDLCERGVVAGDQVAAWEAIRNQVMHGSLVSPYSSEEDDALLINLAGLLHGITRHLINC